MNERVTGFTLIEVLVAMAIFLLVFLGLARVFEMSLNLISAVKDKTGAIALGEERIEFIKNLSYENVGTQGGIPAGPLLQTENLERNRVEYTRKSLVQYIDDPADGLGGSDANGITADYKKVKVTVTWKRTGQEHTAYFITNVAPKGIETLAGGGTLRIQVFDAEATPIPGASVHIENETLDPAVDVHVTTNLAGEVLFPGSPAGSSYKVTVTKSGYSTAQTYDATTQNTEPSPRNLTVAAGNVTTASFPIDKLGAMTVLTYQAYADTTWQDPFDGTSKIATSSGIAVVGGALTLESVGSGYVPEGVFMTTDISPEYLDQWNSFSETEALPPGTSVMYQVYYKDDSGYTLVPDGDLAGNASGFTASSVDLSGLSSMPYRTLRVKGTLETNRSTSTPSIDAVALGYHGGPVQLGNSTFRMHGEKTIGKNAAGDPIYKFDQTHSTDSSGTYEFPSLEWDNYVFLVGAPSTKTIAGTCPPAPASLSPGSSITTEVILAPPTANSLLVSILDPVGDPIQHAFVTLSKTGFSQSKKGTACGQVFFPGLSAGTDYTLLVTKAPYATSTTTNITVDGASDVTVIMSE